MFRNRTARWYITLIAKPEVLIDFANRIEPYPLPFKILR